jgi:hypothetical protein
MYMCIMTGYDVMVVYTVLWLVDLIIDHWLGLSIFGYG